MSLRRAAWNAPDDVTGLQTLRGPAGFSRAPFDRFNLGTNAGDDADTVAANRAELQRLAGLPSVPRWLQQVHGTRVVRFAADDAHVLEEADASVTSDACVVLAILTADCLPVLFCAEDGSEIGAAHAGWRGLASGVLEATRDAMRATRVVAWLGAAAGPRHYEVGVEVRDAFPGFDDAFAPTRPGHWHVDLYGIARRKLRDCGVTDISGGGECTIADRDNFFSYRRDGRTGRQATLLWRA